MYGKTDDEKDDYTDIDADINHDSDPKLEKEDLYADSYDEHDDKNPQADHFQEEHAAENYQIENAKDND